MKMGRSLARPFEDRIEQKSQHEGRPVDVGRSDAVSGALRWTTGESVNISVIITQSSLVRHLMFALHLLSPQKGD